MSQNDRTDYMLLVFQDQLDIYLMVFLRDPGGNTLAVVAAVRAAGAVSATALHQEAAWPENSICPLQLLTQGYREVAWCAAVQSNFLPQQIEIGSSSKTQRRHDQSHFLSKQTLLLIYDYA